MPKALDQKLSFMESYSSAGKEALGSRVEKAMVIAVNLYYTGAIGNARM